MNEMEHVTRVIVLRRAAIEALLQRESDEMSNFISGKAPHDNEARK
jgi:hypothetical protein